MSFVLNLPPSVVAKQNEPNEEEGDDEPKKKTREEYKKQKELEEARKAGTVPAMQDAEGRDINPHIPQYIMQAPWYYGASTPTLNHQRIEEEKEKNKYDAMHKWYKKGIKEGPVATKFRKGACENCGAMTHKKIDCLERPRKIGAKFTGDLIAPDEHLQPNLSRDFDGKRDRWINYDPREHKHIVDEFAKLEEAKKLLKSQKMDEALEKAEEEDMKNKLPGESDDDEDKYADDVEMPGQKFESKQRITVRNLRIREDTAKYLYNLDVNSAYYDPKTRSMRENPLENTAKDPSSLGFTGDNFVRQTGDSMDMSKQQLFAWQAYEKGADVHLQADPTKLELLTKEYDKKKDDYKKDRREGILEKYGGEEHLDAPPRELLLAQSEEYVEFNRRGTVIKGRERAINKSKYEEDVYENNHTSVWGSYWKDGSWGYGCCNSFIRGSYCTGEAGKTAFSETPGSSQLMLKSAEPPMSLVEQHQAKLIKEDEEIDKKKKKKKERRRKKKKRRRRDSTSSSSSSSESEEDEDAAREERIREAMKLQAAAEKEAERILAMDERKRPYNSMMNTKEPTAEEMEAHERRKLHPDDPMAHFLSDL